MTTQEEANTSTYHRVVVTRHGGPDVLQLVTEELPEPQFGEVRINVLAAGVSAYDLMHRRSGSLPGSPRVPYTPGEDVMGVMDQLGEGVPILTPGDRVVGYPRGGGNAEFICLPADEVVPVPPGVDPAEAVCLVANYLTAHLMLHEIAGAQSGERVLVHGAAGGVGSALLELGKQVPMTPNLAEFAPSHQAWYRETLSELLDLLAEGRLKPVVADRIPLIDAARAHERLESGGYAGKVVLVTDRSASCSS